MGLTREQVDALLQPIAGARVSKMKNNRGREASHIQAYDVRRRLDNIFGIAGWSGEVLSCELIYEGPAEIGEQSKPGYEIAYRVVYRLTIHATGAVYTEAAVGDQKMGVASRGDCHDFAIKTAESQALKRAAANLGDQFGLSLYNNGSLAPFVVGVMSPEVAYYNVNDRVVVRPADKDTEQSDRAQDHVTEPLAPEDPAPEDGPPVPPPAQDGPAEAADAGGLPAASADPNTPLPEDMFRDEVEAIAADDTLSTQKKKAALSRVLMRADRAKLRGAVVTHKGHAMSLEALIQKAISGVGK